MHASAIRASAVRPAAANKAQNNKRVAVVDANKKPSSSALPIAAKFPTAASVAAALAAASAAPAFAGDLMTFSSPESAAAAYAAATAGATKVAAGAGAASGAAAALSAGSAAGAGVLDSLSSNPLLAAGAAAGLVIPAALAAILGGGGGGAKGPGKARAVSADAVVEALSSGQAVLVDVRSRESAKQFGTPSLPKGSRKAVTLPFTVKTKATGKGKDASPASYVIDEDFAAKYERLGLATASGEKGAKSVVLLDSFGKEAPAAAAALASAGVLTPESPSLAYVADGAEGPRGWKASGASWREPSKGLSLDLSALKNVGGAVDALAEDFKAAPTAAKAGLAVGAVVAGAALLFQEAETVLELAGLLAAGQFAAKRLVFASDRRRTADELRELVDSKIGVSEAGADLKKVANALLEDPVAAAGGAIKGLAESGPKVPPTTRASTSTSSSSAAAPAAAAAAAATAAPAASSEPSSSADNSNAAEAREWIEKWRAEQAKA